MIDEAIELYGLDPSEFVAARTRLVKELKAAKRKDDAAVVAKLPRPRMGEYTLNRVARDHADVVAAFAKAVRAATSAQSEAIGGRGGAALRASSAELRTATAALVDAAARQLRRDNRDGPAQRDEVLAVVRSLTNESGVAQLAGRHRRLGLATRRGRPVRRRPRAPRGAQEDRRPNGGPRRPRHAPRQGRGRRRRRHGERASWTDQGRAGRRAPAPGADRAGHHRADQSRAGGQRGTASGRRGDRSPGRAQAARQEAADELAALEPDP